MQAGRPAGENPTLGRFESWSQVIGGILTPAGIAGLLSNLAEFYAAADEDWHEWAAFLEALDKWSGGNPFTVAALAKELEPGEDGIEFLRDALPGPLAAALGKPTLRHVLGKALAMKAEARYDGYRLVKAGTHKRKVVARGTFSCRAALAAHRFDRPAPAATPPPACLQRPRTAFARSPRLDHAPTHQRARRRPREHGRGSRPVGSHWYHVRSRGDRDRTWAAEPPVEEGPPAPPVLGEAPLRHAGAAAGGGCGRPQRIAHRRCSLSTDRSSA